MMMTRVPAVAANWKMFKTPQESFSYVELLKNKILDIEEVDIILCVPYTSLFHISPLFNGTNLELGAQNMFQEREGAFTGEISPGMLKASGARWVILGHSERRLLFGETDEEIAGKIRLALSENIRPILCVGETLQERRHGKTLEVLRRQLGVASQFMKSEDLTTMITAYEPVWAIGTGENATPKQIQEAHSAIRDFFRVSFSAAADHLRILYGGSVGVHNCRELSRVEGVDGFLVGGASLEPEKFEAIIRSVC